MPLGIVFDRSELASVPLVRRQLVPLPQLQAPMLRPDVAVVACRAWEDRARAEYVGVMIVRKFHGLLVDLGAPMDLQELALVMLLQEQRHASLCITCARALGSDGEVAFNLEELQQPTSRGLHQELAAMVIGTFMIGEGVAHALLGHAIRALPQSGFKAALRRIQADEVLHARIGGLLLPGLREETWAPWPGDQFAEELWHQTIAAMRIRDVVEPDEAALFTDPEAAAQLRSVGIPDSLAFRAAYHRAVEGMARKIARIGA